MATVALLISEGYLKDLSILDENVDMKLLRVAIMEAQEMHIRHAVGSGIYDQLVAQKIAGTLTPLNTTLLDTYIAPALRQFALYEGVDYLTFKFTNKTIVKKTSDGNTPVEGYDVVRLMDNFKRKGEFYLDRLRKYLIQNDTSYPLYLNPGTDVDTVHADNQPYKIGIYLGRRGKNCCDDKDPYESPGRCCD